jgi:Cys-tRNA(Pro)/Cys-tRNA(Cys) deacylase
MALSIENPTSVEALCCVTMPQLTVAPCRCSDRKITMAAEKLNSMRLLDRNAVVYTVHRYEAADAADAQAVAQLIGRPAGSVFKTLVALPDDARRPVLAMLPADAALDLKKLAAALGLKRLAMAPQRTAEQLTGLLVGGIGALALSDRRWPTVLDDQALALPLICVSAGRRGVMLELAPADLLRVLAAKTAEICRSESF